MLIVSAIAPFILLSSQLRPWTSNSGFSGWVGSFFYPVELVLDRGIRFIDQSFHRYLFLSNAQKENESLRHQLRVLQVKILDYESRLNETHRLRTLLGFAKNQGKEYIAAEVVGRSNLSTFRSLRISRGSREGIQVGMPVLTAQGIVGRIIRTGPFHSDVQLFSDRNFHLDALVERARIRAVVQGISESKMQFNLAQRADVKIGDAVVTSGITGSFPEGLPVGKVIKIQYETDHVSQQITIEPWVDPRSLEEVLVLKRSDEDIQRIREMAGDKWITTTIDELENG